MLYHHTKTAKFKLPTGVKLLSHSGHAKREAKSDRYGSFKIPTILNTSSTDAQIVEAELDVQGNPVKLVYRMPYDQERDIVMPIKVTGSKWLVKTAWINVRNDNHSTVDYSRYNIGNYCLEGRKFK